MGFPGRSCGGERGDRDAGIVGRAVPWRLVGSLIASSPSRLAEGAFDRVRASIDPGWIEEALVATGAATLRRRGLPAEQVIWLDRQEAIRSRTPAGVGQELWGVALGYSLVRLEMVRIGEEADVPPNRISFVMALRLIRDEWLWSAVASPGAIPRHLRELRKRRTAK